MTNLQAETATPTGPSIVALSDDLTGAVALAGEARRRVHDVRVVTWDRAVRRSTGTRALVIDTCSRLIDEQIARSRVRDVLEVVAESEATMYKRVDSYLRGPVAAELDAWTSVLRMPLLIAPAAPSFGLRTLGGVQYAGSEPVIRAFTAGSADAPRTAVVGDLVTGSATITLDDIRGPALTQVLAAALDVGHVVCDGESPSDLRHVARAASEIADRGTAFSLVGSYGLAEAWLRERDRAPRALPRPGVLIVTDSLKQATLDQLAVFRESGELVVMIDPSEEAPSDATVAEWAATLRAGRALALSTVDPSASSSRIVPDAAPMLAAVTLRLVARVRPSGLVVVGGEFASALMQRADCAHLDILAEPWPTSPVAEFCGGALDGMVGILKSGSRGDAVWIAHAVSLLAHLASKDADAKTATASVTR